MTLERDWPPPRGRRSWRSSPVARWALRAALGAFVFALGFAVAEALDDNPDPDSSPTQTLVRTLGPLPLSAPRTVTVTLTTPG